MFVDNKNIKIIKKFHVEEAPQAKKSKIFWTMPVQGGEAKLSGCENC